MVFPHTKIPAAEPGCQASDLVYRLIALFNRREYAAAKALFVPDCRVKIERFAIESLAQLDVLDPAETELIMTASPCFPAGSSTRFTVDTFIYRFAAASASLWVCRIDTELRTDADGEMRITQLNWRTIQSMLPWRYAADESAAVALASFAPLPTGKRPDAAMWVQLRNVQNYFFERPLLDRLPLLAEDVTLSVEGWCDCTGKAAVADLFADWHEAELTDRGRLLFVGMTGVPVLTIAGDRAEGDFLVEMVSTNAKNTPDMLVRTFYSMRTGFVRTADGWRIASMKLRRLAILPKEPYHGGVRYEHMSACPNVWIGGNTPTGVDSPADVFAIENVIAGWVYANRRGEMLPYFQAHMKNAKTQPILHICSFGEEKSKPITDNDAIEARLGGMDKLFHVKQFSLHAATTPIVEISPDGLHAQGTWFDHSMTNLSGNRGPDGVTPYMPFVFKYNHRFEKIDGVWYMTHFFGKPLISLSDWHYDQKKTAGLAGADDDENIPSPGTTLD